MRRKRLEPCIYERGGRFEVIVVASAPTGKRTQLSETADTLSKARKTRDRLRARAARGDVAGDARTTVRGYVEFWIEHRKRLGKVRPRTERRYRELLERHAWDLIGEVKLAKLDAVRLQAVVDRMAARELDPRQIFAVLRAALRQAVRWKLIPYSPAEGVELPAHRRAEQALPTLAELKALLAAAGSVSEPFRAALTIAAACGLRRSEICGLRWTDVDLDSGIVHVLRGLHAVTPLGGGGRLVEHPPKSDRGTRAVEIPSGAAAVLERYRAAQAKRRFLFGEGWGRGWHAGDVVIDDGLGRPINPDVLTRRWGQLRARAGIRKDVRLHDLRALYVTEALAAGVDAGIVSRQAGHATASFTRDVYQRARREDAKAAAAAIDAALGAAFDVPSVDIPLTLKRNVVVPIRRDGL